MFGQKIVTFRQKTVTFRSKKYNWEWRILLCTQQTIPYSGELFDTKGKEGSTSTQRYMKDRMHPRHQRGGSSNLFHQSMEKSTNKDLTRVTNGWINRQLFCWKRLYPTFRRGLLDTGSTEHHFPVNFRSLAKSSLAFHGYVERGGTLNGLSGYLIGQHLLVIELSDPVPARPR